MKLKYLLLILVLTPGTGRLTAAQTPTGLEVMEAYKAQDRAADTASRMKMTIATARGDRRERELALWTKTRTDDTRLQLIRFLSPADVKGTGFLSIENVGRDDDNWLYLPALRKTRRIAGSDKQDRFVGTDFTYEDLESEKLRSYAYEAVGSEEVRGDDAWIVDAIPVAEDRIQESGYGRRRLWVEKEHALVVQVEYYDKSGAFVKRLRAGDIRPIGDSGKWRTHRLVMEDVQSGRSTTLEIEGYSVNQGLADNLFTQRFLMRAGR